MTKKRKAKAPPPGIYSSPTAVPLLHTLRSGNAEPYTRVMPSLSLVKLVLISCSFFCACHSSSAPESNRDAHAGSLFGWARRETGH